MKNTKILKEKSCSFAGPIDWNSLPFDMQELMGGGGGSAGCISATASAKNKQFFCSLDDPISGWRVHSHG